MRKNSDKLTTLLSRTEAARRGWDFEETTWTTRHKDSNGKLRVYTHDLFGFADGIAWPKRPKEGEPRTILLQWTGKGNGAARVKKIQASPRYETVRRAGWGIRVWEWDCDTQKLVNEQYAPPL